MNSQLAQRTNTIRSWKKVALSDVARITNGGTPKSKVAKYWGGDVQWLTPKDMGQMDGREIDSTPRTISKEGLAKSSARLVPKHSVILSTRAPIGHLAINQVPMAFNQGCRGIVPDVKLDHIYLYYFLEANRRLLNDLGSGTTFKELSATNLKSIFIPLAPLDEQKRIVAVLDQAFAALDRARVHA
ncbi:MAG: restriction endonuclease subunit S, partial [Gammaproteobacteria bacterium]